MHESTRVILEYNAGRDPERLTRKLAAIAADRYPGSVLRMILNNNTSVEPSLARGKRIRNGTIRGRTI